MIRDGKKSLICFIIEQYEDLPGYKIIGLSILTFLRSSNICSNGMPI